MRYTLLVLVSGLLMGCVGGGDTVVTGDGNIVEAEDGYAALVADELNNLSTTPEVTDEELTALYEVIRKNALEGNLEASLVMLRVAALQREPEETTESEE